MISLCSVFAYGSLSVLAAEYVGSVQSFHHFNRQIRGNVAKKRQLCDCGKSKTVQVIQCEHHSMWVGNEGEQESFNAE